MRGRGDEPSLERSVRHGVQTELCRLWVIVIPPTVINPDWTSQETLRLP